MGRIYLRELDVKETNPLVGSQETPGKRLRYLAGVGLSLEALELCGAVHCAC